MAIEAAVLRAKVEVEGIQQAQSQLQGFGAQIGTVGNQAKTAGGGVTQLGGAADAAGKKVAGAGKQAGLLNTVMGDMSAKSLLMGAGLAGVGLQAVNMGKAAVGAAVDWESSLAGIAKTLDTTGLSVAEADAAVVQMGDDIRQMATEIPLAATELAGVAEAAGQLGIARDDVVSFTETMAKLGVATDLTAEQAATSIARIANITGLATDDVDNFGSALVDLGNNSAASESEILAMATRIAAAGEIAGLTEGEILGLSAALTSVGINAEAGGTAITQVMNEIETSVESADDRLATFAQIAGMSAEQFAAAWRESPNEAIVAFVEGLGNVTETGGSTVQILDELGLDGIRVSQALNSAAGAGDLMRESMDRGNTAMEENVALNKEAEQRFETTASKIQLAKNRLNEYNLELSEGYLPAVGAALSLSEPLLQTLIESARIYGDLATMIRDVNSALDDYIPTIGGAGDSSTSFAESFANVMTNLIPGVSTIKTVTGAWGLYNDETAESTALTEAQAATLNTWVAIIEDAIPGIQSQGEVTRENNAAMADYEQQIRDASAASIEHAQTSIAAAEAQQVMTAEGHRGIQMADEMGVSISGLDRAMQDLNTEGVDPLQEALDGLAGAYQEALDVMGAFNSQASEFEGISNTITAAYEEIQAKQEAGIDLTDKEITFLQDHEEALGRLEGGQRDATIEAGFAALAATELMEAQDALNQAIEDGVTDLTPYKDAVAQAEEKLGIMGSTTGATQDAQTALKDTIQGPLIGAIQSLTRELEYVSKPWLIEIDAATAAAEAEIARIKGIISAGATLPVTVEVSGGDVGGIVNHASGTGPSGTPRDMLSWVGEEGPELAWLPQGTHVLPSNESMKFASLMGQIPGFQDGTGGGALPGSPGGASAGSLPGSPPPPPHGGSMGVDWEAIAEAEAEAWVKAWGDAVDAAMSDNPAGFVENIQDEINDLQTKLDLAPALGVPESVVEGWEADLADLQGESSAFWASLAEGIASGLIDPAVLEELDEAGKAQLDAYLTPIVGEEGAQKIIDGIGAVTQITAEGLGQLRTIFEEDTEAAVGYIDDLVQAALDGSITWADAMGLMAEVPRDDLLPVLEDLEQQFEDDLVQAILATDDAAQAVAEQGLAMVADALANINSELGDLMGFSEGFARRGSGGVGVITSAGGGGGGGGGGSGGSGGGSSGGGSGGGLPSDLGGGGGGFTSGLADPMIQARLDLERGLEPDYRTVKHAPVPRGATPLDELVTTFFGRPIELLKIGDDYLGLSDDRMGFFLNDRWSAVTRRRNADPVRTLALYEGVNTFFMNPPGPNDAYMGDREHALDFLSFGGSTLPPVRVPDRFAEGGITLGPSLAILGDNASGREMVLPFERNQEFARQIAQELHAQGLGGGAPIIIESLVVGDEKIQGPFATRVAGKIFQGFNSHLNQSGIPMNINRR